MKRWFSKNIKNKIFESLPVGLKHQIIRSLISIPLKEDNNYIYKLAEDEDELEQAYSLLHDCYVSQGFIQPQKNRMRILPHFILPTTVSLVAKFKNNVVGTLSIIKNGPLKLPMEKEFSLDFLKQQNASYAEISALAVKKEFRRVNGGAVFFMMLKYMYHYCVTELNIRTLCIVIHPKDEDFYTALMFFKRIPEQKIIDYMGAPALSMYLDLDQAKIDFDAVYSHLSEDKNFLSFFMRKISNLHFIERPYKLNSFCVVTPEIFQRFFIKKNHFFDLITFNEYKILKRALIHTDLFSFFVDDSIDEISKRSEIRFTVNIQGKTILNEQIFLFDVFDVSSKGLSVTGRNRLILKEGDVIVMHLQIGEGIISKITSVVVWAETPRYGLGIVAFDASWSEFVNYLYKGKNNYLFKVG
jgi:hypothetical protein